MDMSRYLDLFVSEARQHLQGVEKELSRIADLSPAEAAEPLNNLFRHFHSLKGMAASMGFAEIATLSHAVEDLFDGIREQPDTARRPGVSDLVLEALDTVARMVDAAAGGATEFPSQAPLIARVKDSAVRISEPQQLDIEPADAGAPPEPPGPRAPAAAASSVFRCQLRIDPGAELPTARAALVMRTLESLGSILTSTPAREDLGRGPFDGSLTFLLSTESSRKELAAALEDLVDVASYNIIEETLPTASQALHGPEVREAEPALPSMIRIPTAALDGFLDTLSELITWRGSLGASLRAADAGGATESHRKLSRAIDRLRGEVMAIRLLPFEHIVPHLNQSVRTLCRQTGKRVSLQISGTEVALDRAVLEEILDPLNHLLRNAVDHGIEGEEERRAAGKEPGGRILIAVSRVGDRVQVRLEDDGRGMDTERILRQAVEGGFISPTEAVPLSPDEILMLTTIPGFSTTEKLSEISGRGVGMDVVRTRVEKLNGRMVLKSQPGRGLEVLMDLPLTVAVIEAFLVEASGVVFAVPASLAERTLLVEAAAVRRSRSGFFLEEGETLLPAFRPDEALGMLAEPRALAPQFPVILFSSDDVRAALAVDAILERRELVVKPLGSLLEHLREYSGAALLDDGTIALILDVRNLAHLGTAS